ncbi:MAG TPA: zf-TFIIB domain-containing protein [Clostridiaceae bacterium]
MKCLVCKDVDLEESELSPGLKVHRCNSCSGSWLKFGDYLEWSNCHDIETVESNPASIHSQVIDSDNPKVCPDCGTILSVYKVANNLAFKLEHCATCNGIWLDKGEWTNLEENNMNHKINKFFTETWQKNLRDDELREYFEDFYKSRFGTEGYEKIKEVKEWLDNNDKNKSMLIAFLLNNDPYKL